MKNKESIGILLVALGIIAMLISFNDIISILVDIVGKLFKLELPVVFFSSFLFRALITCIGGIICLSGALILKNKMKWRKQMEWIGPVGANIKPPLSNKGPQNTRDNIQKQGETYS